MKKRLISFCMALLMLVSLLPSTAFAEGTVSIAVGSATVEAGGTATVDVNIAGAESAAFMAVYLQFDFDSALTLSNVVLSEAATAAGFTFGVNNLANGLVQVEGNTSAGSSIADGVFLTLTFAVSEDAAGSYNVSVKYKGDDAGNVYDIHYSDVACTFTDGSVTIGSASAEGVTLAAAATNDNPVRVGATNPIKVNVGVGQDYAATEMTITYPSSLVSFDEDSSTLGTATVDTTTAGTIKLADYGADKTASASNYVLAFTVNATAAATAEFKVTKAGLGTGTSAADANLTAVTELGSVSIAIENAQYNVTLPDDGLFYAETTVVEADGTFTFYPEQSTGGYYDYTLPTAAYADGTPATVTATSDGGWQITNVNGDVTINDGNRTPKSYGDVTYKSFIDTQESEDVLVSNQTTTATYLTDIKFTIPKDVAAGTQDGYEYTVTAKIGESNYNFGAPTTDSDGNRTYTISGADVKGAVIVTVTKTTLVANKVTVSIDGNASADGKYAGTESAGASVQIDKTTGSATLTVDTTSGLNKGYNYAVSASAGTLTENDDGTYTISSLTQDATITITKTINVEGVKNQVEINGESKSFVTLDSESGRKMWLIQLPNHVDNTTTAVYKYDGQQMYWSADHKNYVIVVISTAEPAITADMFTLETVTATPTIASNNWDVNKSGTVDANDAQLIWNMYKSVYTEFSTAANGSGATAEKFMLADANHDGVLNLDDAVVIINQILSKNSNN